MEIFHRDKFTFSRTFFDLINECPSSDRLAFITNIIRYGLDYEADPLHDRAFELFLMAKIEMDKSWKLYQNGCQNPQSHRKGGAPYGNHNASRIKPNQSQNKTKVSPYIYKNSICNKVPDNNGDSEENNLSDIEDEYRPVVKKWLKYKRERGEDLIAQSSVIACYNKLLALSKKDSSLANQIVEQSMAYGWKGLFRLVDGTRPKVASAPSSTMNTGVRLEDNSVEKYTNDKILQSWKK